MRYVINSSRPQKLFKKSQLVQNCRASNLLNPLTKNDKVIVGNRSFQGDDYTNVTDKILSLVGRNLHVLPYHPLSLVRQRIVNYFYKSFDNGRGSPVFSVFDNLSPTVSVEQNFDTLLVPPSHPSRLRSDCYYINRHHLLRAHTTAHQAELLRSGLNNFLITGDVYRRDEIDRTHYPVFHQLDAVRLRTRNELFSQDQHEALMLFQHNDNSILSSEQVKQACHSLEAYMLMEHELKFILVGLAKDLFGDDIKYRWVNTTFPFTQPSWELEIYHRNDWLEVLGCGIMVQSILSNAGVMDRIGWAFGIGLERIAMCLYEIPDIRLFWSQDSGFLNQFKIRDLNQKITYKQISQYPQCNKDISFWIPPDTDNFIYSNNDFYDLVRNVGGDIVEQVLLVDKFIHPKNGRKSHCYRIVYRHMEKTLLNEEVNVIHNNITEVAKQKLGIVVR